MEERKGVTRFASVNGQNIAFSITGQGPPVLLLHGFPQNQMMWHGITPELAQEFTVITADLRGYGASSKPTSVEAMSFRAMAADQVSLMRHLGFERFHLVGHDRGARTAHRLALDAPAAVLSLTLMDIVPTHLLLDQLRQDVARAYYHWFFLAQPAPFPETLIGHDPDAFFESCLKGWGGSIEAFAPHALEAYRVSWRQPECIHTMCNDYRAAIDLDFDLDAIDLGRKVEAPAQVLYGADGVMGKAYDVGATWAKNLASCEIHSLPGGHFFPDTHPAETAQCLLRFLRSTLQDQTDQR